MGYSRSTLKLVWPEDSEFAGLEIRMKRLSIRKLLEVQALDDLRASKDNKESIEAMDKIIDILAGALIGWNLEIDSEDGEATTPVPATRESLADQDVALVLELLSNWVAVASSVPLDLKKNSDNIAQPPAPSPEEWADWAMPPQVPLSEHV